MPLKGAGVPCSFPWEKAAQTWTSLPAAGGKETARRELWVCSQGPRAAEGSGGWWKDRQPRAQRG